MVEVPESHQDLLDDETKAFAYLATSMPDGSPQLTCLWFNMDGDKILFNTGKERVKTRNVQKDPRVAIAIYDPENPYRYLQFRGEIETTTEDADQHVHAVSRKYTGEDFEVRPGDPRVKYVFKPEHVFAWG
ncbi:MAG TPA: PPOX class F420-dependent oxidoreductase [Anaerolineales bacterium]